MTSTLLTGNYKMIKRESVLLHCLFDLNLQFKEYKKIVHIKTFFYCLLLFLVIRRSTFLSCPDWTPWRVHFIEYVIVHSIVIHTVQVSLFHKNFKALTSWWCTLNWWKATGLHCQNRHDTTTKLISKSSSGRTFSFKLVPWKTTAL